MALPQWIVPKRHPVGLEPLLFRETTKLTAHRRKKEHRVPATYSVEPRPLICRLIGHTMLKKKRNALENCSCENDRSK